MIRRYTSTHSRLSVGSRSHPFPTLSYPKSHSTSSLLPFLILANFSSLLSRKSATKVYWPCHYNHFRFGPLVLDGWRNHRIKELYLTLWHRNKNIQHFTNLLLLLFEVIIVIIGKYKFFIFLVVKITLARFHSSIFGFIVFQCR